MISNLEHQCLLLTMLWIERLKQEELKTDIFDDPNIKQLIKNPQKSNCELYNENRKENEGVIHFDCTKFSR